jgi:hypothetical protein
MNDSFGVNSRFAKGSEVGSQVHSESQMFVYRVVHMAERLVYRVALF